MEWEEKRFFVHMVILVCHVILKEVQNQIFRHNHILDTHVCIKNPYWQRSEIIRFLCKYYIPISDTLIGSWMCFSCCSKGKIKLQEKVHGRIYVRDIRFSAARPPIFFVAFFVHSIFISPFPSYIFVERPL